MRVQGASRAALNRQPVLVKRPIPVFQDRVQRIQRAAPGVQPRVDVVRPDRHDAPVVPRRCHLGRRLVGDRRERQQVGLAGGRPARPQARHQHVLRRPRPELQHPVLRRFALGQLPPFDLVPWHVLEEGVDHYDPVREPEQVLPEPPQVVAPGVVSPRVLGVVNRRLARRPALVAHRQDRSHTFLHHQHRCVLPREDPRVPLQHVGAPQVGEPLPPALDLVGCDAPALGRRLGELDLQQPFGVGQALALGEQVLLALGHLRRRVRRDGLGDAPFTVRLRGCECGFHRFRYLHARVGRAAPEQVHERPDVELRAELPDIAAVVRPDLRRVTHRRSSPPHHAAHPNPSPEMPTLDAQRTDDPNRIGLHKLRVTIYLRTHSRPSQSKVLPQGHLLAHFLPLSRHTIRSHRPNSISGRTLPNAASPCSIRRPRFRIRVV
ncbi:hypothetical protein BH11PSE8_BH11PSE8_30670 [soil metagenome]